MAAGAFTLSGMLASGATLLDSYSHAGLLAMASVVLGYGIWTLLSVYTKINADRDEIVRDLSQKYTALNDAVIVLSQKIDDVGEVFNKNVIFHGNTLNSLSSLAKELESFIQKSGSDFIDIQTLFREDLVNIKKLHQEMAQNDVALQNSMKADFQNIRDNIQEIHNKHLELTKDMFNNYVEGTLDQMDSNHQDIKAVIDKLSENNSSYIMNINTSIETMIKKLMNNLQSLIDDIDSKYKEVYNLFKEHPRLIEELKDELIKLQEKQQDINEQDIKLMERIISGR